MYNWLTSMNRKRHQRAMNKIVRELNKNIQNDELWQGRFYVRQVHSEFSVYEDKSGAELWVVLEFVDRKTGLKKVMFDTVNHWRHWNAWRLFREMNDFIVEDVKVWSENPRPGSKEYENA